MNKTILRSASFILAVVLALGVFTPGQATSPNAALMPNKIVNLAHFYKPPSNSTAAIVASNFSTVFLTGGDENFRNQLLTNGFASSIPQYFRAEGIQDPGNCTNSPANNQIAYKPGDFCDISQNHPDWFLLDTNGNRMRTSPTSNYYRMDPGNAGWRNFFLTRLLEMNQQKGWNGVFLDNLEASLSEIKRDGITPAKYPDDASYQAVVRGFIQFLNQNYTQPYGYPVVANIIARSTEAQWFDYIQYMDGALQERWAVGWDSPDYVSESKWNSDMQLAEKTQAQGKFIILMAQGDQADTTRQKFSFASYLLVANGKAAFRYGNEDVYDQVWLYDNYKVNLGTPLGARYQTGTTWRRDFTNGYVIVDPVSHAATISTTPVVAPTTTATNTSVVAPTATATSTPVVAPTITATNTSVVAPTITATNTSVVAPTATATNTPVVSETLYDNKNPAFVYSGSWTDVSDAQAHGGSFKLTQAVGSDVKVNFTGSKFGIVYKTGPLFGNMDVYVDGNLVGTINQKTSTATYKQKWTYNGTLAGGTHALKLVFSGPSGARVSFDAISLLSNAVLSMPTQQQPTQTVTNTPAPTLPPANTATPVPTSMVYDDKNSAFVYSSGWTTVTGVESYGGGFKLTQVVGSSVTLSFTGQKFSVIYKTGPLFGKMDVYVDGNPVGTINQYTSTATFQKKWSYGGTLTAGTHTLKLVYVSPSGARVSLDAVSIP